MSFLRSCFIQVEIAPLRTPRRALLHRSRLMILYESRIAWLHALELMLTNRRAMASMFNMKPLQITVIGGDSITLMRAGLGDMRWRNGWRSSREFYGSHIQNPRPATISKKSRHYLGKHCGSSRVWLISLCYYKRFVSSFFFF